MDQGPSGRTGFKCKKRSETQACGFLMGTPRVEWGLPASVALRVQPRGLCGQAGSSSVPLGGIPGLAGCLLAWRIGGAEMGKVHAGWGTEQVQSRAGRPGPARRAHLQPGARGCPGISAGRARLRPGPSSPGAPCRGFYSQATSAAVN